MICAATLAPFASATAQTSDDRFPFLSAALSASGETQDVEVGPAESGPIIVARVPFPRPAPRRQKMRSPAFAATGQVPPPAALEEPSAPTTQVAYAAGVSDAPSPLAWLLRQAVPEPRAAEPATVTGVVPDRAALPHLEPRYHLRRVPIAPPDLVVLIENKAIAHGVPLDLAHAVVRIESNYDPRLTGGRGALGLMQIKHATARGMGFSGSAKDLFDPTTNLEWGMRYLGRAYKLARGDLCGTIMKYQGGHRMMHMTPLSTAYCGKAKRLMAAR